MQPINLKKTALVEVMNVHDVVRVALEAQETAWEYAPGHVVAGYGFKGRSLGR
ncbi:MAG: hypothetical protein IPM53_00850 [Anaerolineaceae bacterium]|nr:hypothetical protein [Anaerolineaceae bacterium]